MGSNPYRLFAGTMTGPEEELVSIPEGQTFIITAMDLHGDFELWRDGTELIGGNVVSTEYAKKGLSRIPVEGGATLSLRFPAGYAVEYLLQGYFTAAGSPYRFVHGTVATSVPQVIFENEADSVFLVRTFVATMNSCFLHLDGTRILRQNHTWDGNSDRAFLNRQGALPVPPGSRLSTSSSHSSVSCDYLMEGEYLQP